MSWEAIGACGEIVGAIAVVVTLVYLARQIGQSVSVSRASQNRSLQAAFEGFNDVILSNPELVDVLGKLENPETVHDDPTSVRIRHLSYRWFNVWTSAQTSYTNHQISSAEFEFFKDDVNSILKLYPGLAPYFADFIRRYPSAKNFEIFEPVLKLM